MSRKTVVELYKSKGQWRWRMTDGRNGKIIGASTEGYRAKAHAVANLNRVGYVRAHVLDRELISALRFLVVQD